MKKLIFLLSISILSIQATPPDCQRSYRLSNRTGDTSINSNQEFTALSSLGAGNTGNFDNRATGCNSWIMSYDSEGFSAISITFQDAPAGNGAAGTFVTFAGTTVSGSNPSTTTTSATYSATGYYPYLRISLASSTGTGSINVTLFGWKSNNYLSGITIYQGLPLTGASFPAMKSSPVGSGDTDIYTAPTGKRVMVETAGGVNTVAGTVNWYLELKSGGSYYRLSTSVASTNTVVMTATTAGIILDPGESISIHTDATGLNVQIAGIQYDSFVNYKSIKILGLTTGINLFYTVPTGKSAYVTANTMGFSNVASTVPFVTDAGGQRIVFLCYDVVGDAANSCGQSTSNNINATSNGTIAASTRGSLTTAGITMGSGDFLLLSIDTGAATQIGWVNVWEI